MATQKPFSLSKLKPDFNFVDCGDLRAFLYRGMVRFGNFLWGLVYNFLLFLFGFLDRYLDRLEADENSGISNSSYTVEKSVEKGEILKYDWAKKSEHFVVFETEESIFRENVANTSKYEINSGKDLREYFVEPKATSFIVEEMFSESGDNFIVNDGNEENRGDLAYLETNLVENNREKGKIFMVENKNDQIIDQIPHSYDFGVANLVTGDKTEEYPKESDFGNSKKNISNEINFQEKLEIEKIDSDLDLGELRFSPSNLEIEPSDNIEEEKVEDSVQISSEETNLENEEKEFPNKNDLIGNEEIKKSDSGDFSGQFLFSFMNSELLIMESIKGASIISQKVHPISYDEEIYFPVDKKSINLEIFDGENDDEFIELDPNLHFSTNKREEEGNISENFEKKYDLEVEDDDDDEFDILLQHQENIEKLKMEMKISKKKGLPTILENCESFKNGEDLKPLKIDEKKFEHKDRVEEIQNVYKSYSEKMKKLDILNYQTLNAINFMQLKDPNQQNSSKKSSNSAIKSIWPSKLRRIHADPTLKSIFEMHKNLEIVYIGQICLSWETLRWEHEKAKELLEYDSEGHRSYNLVAGEFQQFQVLVQRFVENEQFLGPRVLNYAKNRCELRVFLQVPVIKEDCLNEKKENSIEGEYEISISMLSDVIDETMRVFWEFVRTDHKADKFPILKGLSANRVDLQDPSDSELLVEIKTNLQTKEKKLKDILRTANCIVKKFQKQQEGRTDLDLLFAQIDLKLVSRVLNLSKLTTYQLMWCQNKLHKVKISSRKVHVEPYFSLFPF